MHDGEMNNGTASLLTEFRHHRKVDNPLHIIGFLSQWKLYLDQLPADPSQPFTGRKLDPTLVEKVRFAFAGSLACADRFPALADVGGADRAAVRAHARHQGCLEACFVVRGGSRSGRPFTGAVLNRRENPLSVHS